MGTGSVASLVLEWCGVHADGACPLFRAATLGAVEKGDRHRAGGAFTGFGVG